MLILVTINNFNTIYCTNQMFSEYSNDDQSKSGESKWEGNSNEENKNNKQNNIDSSFESNETENNDEAQEDKKSDTNEDFEEILEPYTKIEVVWSS